MPKKNKQEDDGFYRNEKGKLDFPPDHIGKKTYMSCKGFDYSVPIDYTVYLGGTRYFLGDPDIPESVLPAGYVYKGTDVRHQFTKQGPAEPFRNKLTQLKKWYGKDSKINDWS
jgi:hypothetical protein